MRARDDTTYRWHALNPVFFIVAGMNKKLKDTLDDLLLDGLLPELVSPQVLARVLADDERAARSLTIQIGIWLKSIGAQKHGRYTRDGVEPVSLWSIRNHKRYRSLGPAKRLAIHRESLL